ncbi:translation initiation factor IF-2, putative [Babesia ovata]|uniref:Translation initiation factor IF-2, putative n=1 Tax=Babesia ovata TaxID=189622 RepID=A0A2H6KB19_9APIC|nr:translation initiation factor IF-2, putative [Babesia ovata]GBE60193.1 translation initiation factor IF-2, putative [Babesia ovata]
MRLAARHQPRLVLPAGNTAGSTVTSSSTAAAGTSAADTVGSAGTAAGRRPSGTAAAVRRSERPALQAPLPPLRHQSVQSSCGYTPVKSLYSNSEW